MASQKALNDCTSSCVNTKKDIIVDDEGHVMTVEIEDDEQLLMDIAGQSMIELDAEAADKHKQSQAIHHLLGELNGLDSAESDPEEMRY
jgi:hypothetical protein